MEEEIVQLKTGQDWNNRFQSKFPLAPTKLVKQGLIDDQTYKLGLDLFTECDTIHTVQVLEAVKRYLPESDFKPLARDLGCGLGHTSKWIGDAINLGFRAEAWDFSSDACQATALQLEKLGIKAQDLVHEGEIEELSQRHLTHRPVLDHLVRVVQHWDKEKLNRTFRGLARQSEPGQGLIILGHPFPDDNPDYEYATSYKYDEQDFLEPLSEGAQTVWVVLERSAPLDYLGDQLYMWVTLGPATLQKYFPG